MNHVLNAFGMDLVKVHDLVTLRHEHGDITTTVGRVILNSVLPINLQFVEK
jgi:hypothetical protein